MRIKASEYSYPPRQPELKYGPKNEDFYIPVFKTFCFVTEKFHQNYKMTKYVLLQFFFVLIAAVLLSLYFCYVYITLSRFTLSSKNTLNFSFHPEWMVVLCHLTESITKFSSI